MKARVLHVGLAVLQRRVLHFGREGMRDWIAKNAQANWRIDILRRFAPILEVGESIALGCVLFFHVILNGVRDLTQTDGACLVQSVIQAS